MSHRLRKDDPLFYKMALNGLIAEAKENNVNVHISYNTVVFDDEKDGIVTTICSVPIELAKRGDCR